jgi:hypothetical protein
MKFGVKRKLFSFLLKKKTHPHKTQQYLCAREPSFAIAKLAQKRQHGRVQSRTVSGAKRTHPNKGRRRSSKKFEDTRHQGELFQRPDTQRLLMILQRWPIK